MNISSLSTSTAQSISSIIAPSTTPASSSSSSSSSSSPATQVSGRTQLLSKLQSLEQSDPAKAKQVLDQIASKLKAAGNDQLAAKFQHAADTGDLSALAPPAGAGKAHGGGGHHHHKAAQAYAASSSTTSTDPSDVASALQEALGA